MGENSAISVLLDAARNRQPQDNLFHLFYALTETDSYKARDLVLRAIGSGSLRGSYSWLLIRKLIEEKYLSQNLKEFYEKQVEGMKEDARKEKLAFLLSATQLAIKELGVTPDVALLQYLLKGAKGIGDVNANIAKAKEWKSKFDSIRDRDELIDYLTQEKERSLLYFIIYGGRTRFALVNNYDSEKFWTVLNVAKGLRVHEGPLDEFLSSLKQEGIGQIRKRLLAGSFPPGGTYSRSIRVDVSSSSQAQSLETRAAQVFGSAELGVLLKLRIYLRELSGTPLGERLAQCRGLADASTAIAEAESQKPDLIKAVEKELGSQWRKLGEKKVLEMSLYAALTSPQNPVKLPELIKNLETQRKALQSAVRDQYRSKSIDKMVRDERLAALEEKGKAKLMRYILQELAGGANTETEALVFSEWESHMDQVFQDFERLRNSETKISKERTVTLRWLDKRDDLIECLRFADSAQCCFNSKNYRIEGHQVGAAEWIVRLWKDPLSFIFLIEDSPGDAVGFVFGSFGLHEGKPIVMLNGVYMEGKTDTAAQSILQAIEEDFTRKLGCTMQVVASRYGGTAKLGKGYSNSPIQVRRLRALMGRDGNPETQIYDDLNVGINSPGTTDGMVWHKTML